MFHFLAHVLGLDDPASAWYGFWSGFGSDLQELAMFGAIYGIYRKHNCHARPCWRLGLFPAVEGKGWHYCRKHHKDGGIHK